MLCRTQVRATLVVAIAALAMLGACSDGGDDLAGPPIPTLAGQAPDGGIETVAEGSLDAGCPCAEWACAISVCGYDTATDSRGACCTQCTTGSIPPEPKPSCDPGGGSGGGDCSEQPGAGEWGVDFCNGEPGDYCPTNPNYCPPEWVCCFGGPYGDGPFGPY